MFCTNCGNGLQTEDNFCGQCGKAIRHAQTSIMTQVQTKTEQPAYQEPPVPRQPDYSPPPIKPSHNRIAESKTEKKREEMRADLKVLLEKEQQREVADQELFEAEHWIRGYAEVIADIAKEEYHRQERLKESPKGFHLEGEGYSCFICGNSISKEQTWYDKHGIKCLICQSAVDKKILALAVSDKDSWYSVYDLERSFFIKPNGIRRFVKEGLLKPRIVPGSSERSHYQLFFIKDHEGILPPKKLTDWPMVKDQKDGEDWYHSEPWFMHTNPAEILKGYKILDYLQTLTEKEINESFPTLNFQLSKAAKSMMKINHINPEST